MSALLAALFAFIGSIFGAFVANDLDAARKRREVRRTQIEKFAEALIEDQHWVSSRKDALLFLHPDAATPLEPFERAHVIQQLYFRNELREAWLQFMQGRHAYMLAMSEVYTRRLADARETLRELGTARDAVDRTLPNETLLAAVEGAHTPYYESLLHCLSVAADIAQQTIPDRSALLQAWDALLARLRSLGQRPK